MAKMTLENFIERGSKIHKNRYDYSRVDINQDKVIIGCVTHGYFSQNRHSHLRGVGCSRCAVDKLAKGQTLTQETVIEQFRNVHGDLYDYSEVIYRKSCEKVKIICREHGVFLQKPHRHKKGQGCPKCKGFISKQEYIRRFSLCGSNLYIMGIENGSESFFKIGRAVDVLGRVQQIERDSNYKVTWCYYIKGKPDWVWDTEVSLHKAFKPLKYKPEKSFGGHSECFDGAGGVIAIAEFFNRAEKGCYGVCRL